MEAFLEYFLRSQAYLLLFGLGYLVIYRPNPIPSINRFFLLFSLSSAAILPLVPSFVPVNASSEVASIFMLPELLVVASGVVSNGTEVLSETTKANSWIMLILGVFYIVLLILLAIKTLSLISLMLRNHAGNIDGMRLVVLNSNQVPFSFFGWLFIPEGLDKNPAFRHILWHEKAHAMRFHSADILLTELFRLLFWINPMFYLMRKELKTMHEFEADALALTHCERISYQTTLVEMNFRGLIVPLTNPYNVSLIKKRMLMMNKNSKHMSTTKPWLLSGALILLMVVALVFQSFKPMDYGIREGTLTEPQVMEQSTIHTVSIEDSLLFVVVEEMPEYPGGSEAMMNFFVENIKYPEQARKDSIQGRVFVNFIVEADGKVSNAKVLRGIGGGCDEEAVRVVSLMPAWTPGKQRGKNVRVSFNLPIMFSFGEK